VILLHISLPSVAGDGHRQYLREVARREGATLVEDFLDGVVPGHTYDGLHPDEQGQAILAERLLPRPASGAPPLTAGPGFVGKAPPRPGQPPTPSSLERVRSAGWPLPFIGTPACAQCFLGFASFPTSGLGSGTKPSRFGIFTCGSVWASMTSVSPMMPFRWRRYAVTA
jgi:hypothetical protein